MPKLSRKESLDSFDTRTDLRTAYEQVAAAYGIKAAFDPDLPARNVRFRVKDVDFETAMKVLMLQTGTFWRPLNSKLNVRCGRHFEKRKAFEMEMEQTFPLPSTVDSCGNDGAGPRGARTHRHSTHPAIDSLAHDHHSRHGPEA